MNYQQSKMVFMKTNYIFFGISVIWFASCTSAYKVGQTPDDVYYAPTQPTSVYAVSKQNNNDDYYTSRENFSDNQYLRMRARNRYRSLQVDDINYWYGNTYSSWGSTGGCSICPSPWSVPYYNPYNNGYYGSVYGNGWYGPAPVIIVNKYPSYVPPPVRNKAALDGYNNNNYNNSNYNYKVEKNVDVYKYNNNNNRTTTPSSNSSREYKPTNTTEGPIKRPN